MLHYVPQTRYSFPSVGFFPTLLLRGCKVFVCYSQAKPSPNSSFLGFVTFFASSIRILTRSYSANFKTAVLQTAVSHCLRCLILQGACWHRWAALVPLPLRYAR